MPKYGNVLNYRNCEEAKQYLEKRCVFFDTLKEAEDFLISPDKPTYSTGDILLDIRDQNNYPFISSNSEWQFIVPIIEDDELMTYEELFEWEAKGFGVHSMEGSELWFSMSSYTKEGRKQQVCKDLVIRYHGSDEILKPTKAIFLKDCRGGKVNG